MELKDVGRTRKELQEVATDSMAWRELAEGLCTMGNENADEEMEEIIPAGNMASTNQYFYLLVNNNKNYAL